MSLSDFYSNLKKIFSFVNLPARGFREAQPGTGSIARGLRRSVYSAELEQGKSEFEDKDCMGCSRQVRVRELPARPRYARVAVETTRSGMEVLRWIEDANGALHCFEYDGERLAACVDISANSHERWRAEYDQNGNLRCWRREDDEGGCELMAPHLEAIDKNGNRYFRAEDGGRIIVKPSGAAFAI